MMIILKEFQIIIVNAQFLSRIPAEGNLDEPSSLDLV